MSKHQEDRKQLECVIKDLKVLYINASKELEAMNVRYRELWHLNKEADKELEAKDKYISVLKGLVSAARCPNCDGGGAYYDNEGNPAQCQWCYEVELLTNKEGE